MSFAEQVKQLAGQPAVAAQDAPAPYRLPDLWIRCLYRWEHDHESLIWDQTAEQVDRVVYASPRVALNFALEDFFDEF